MNTHTNISGIYIITNHANGQFYIGQSSNICSRLADHLHEIQNQKSKDAKYIYMYNDMFRSGIENISFEILEQCDKDKLNEREIYYINKYGARYYGYNKAKGGGVNNRKCDRKPKPKWSTWHVMTNGEINKQIAPSDIDNYLNNGWKFGEWYKYNNDKKLFEECQQLTN